MLRYIDEVFVTICFILFISLICIRQIPKAAKYILLYLFLLGAIGLTSGFVNNNPAHVTLLGIFDYVKNFLIIPLFGVLYVQEKRAIILYNILHLLALFLCVVAIIQEITFLSGIPVTMVGVTTAITRQGFLRTPSLMGNPNVFGLYSLMFLVLHISLKRRFSWQALLLATGVILSLSRMSFLSFLLTMPLILMKIKGKNISRLVIILILAVFCLMVLIGNKLEKNMIGEGRNSKFREYAMVKSLEIWKDHPFLGVGPGRYGGPISMLCDSPIYGKYGFSSRWFTFMSKFNTIDQFWPQVIAEIGIIGLFAFGGFLFFLCDVAEKEEYSAQSIFKKRILAGLSVVPVILVVCFIGSGQNLVSILLTYSILFAVCLRTQDRGTINYSQAL